MSNVPEPIEGDMALIGDTKQELQTKPLPRVFGPNYGLGKGKAPGDDYRVTD